MLTNVSDKQRDLAIDKIVDTGVKMVDDYLTLDILTLSLVFIDPEEFDVVIDIIINEINDSLTNPNRGEPLKGNLKDLKKIKFFSSFQKDQYEDMRKVNFLSKELEVIGFGHRWPPQIEKDDVLVDRIFYETIYVRV